ncbi:MAG: nitrite reductase small subunit [Cellulomonas sp. 73-145]|uniref:nitrite reductase small subunit NirD n=1 Tax=Cellulomonas sp. 73-145 TaxID=1895739 RepID=UPI00092BBBA6|nr:nitrite reductase small subunit NirD [Cellulomonas sp. 73-145]OJV57581.1 MAG: nitrite reductase small subunit [Cellulomonas sp. 73-145]
MSRPQPGWTVVCQLTDLVPERGAAALVDGEQVALFRVGNREVLAVQQLDPYSGAHVMSRGIVGSRAGAVTVASPMYKQVFDLRTGACLDPVGKEPQHLRTWPVRVEGDVVLVGTAGALVDALVAPLATPATLDATEAP